MDERNIALRQTKIYYMLKIENEYTLSAYIKSGINLFIGSAFSIMSQDANGKNLPVGKDQEMAL